MNNDLTSVPDRRRLLHHASHRAWSAQGKRLCNNADEAEDGVVALNKLKQLAVLTLS
jgi:hypothetical protein